MLFNVGKDKILVQSTRLKLVFGVYGIVPYKG